jgi:DNA-binding response OmpR family regulator
MNRIALVEDHERMSELLVRALRDGGIETDIFDRMAPVLLAAGDTAYGSCSNQRLSGSSQYLCC